MLLLRALLLIFIPAGVMSQIPTHYCPATDCGGVKITYPFWVISPAATNATSFCGYRDLNVTCDSRLASKPTLRTKLGDFTVSEFDGSTRTFTLLDPDATTGGACPHVRRNFTIQRAGIKLLEYGPEVVNLTFFYNCSGERHDLLQDFRIGCSRLNGDSKSSSSYVFPEMAVNPAHANMYNHCVGPVVMPVMRSAVVMKNISGTFQDALRGGFQLRWVDSGIDYCEICEMNKGYCGGSNGRARDSGLICVCENGLLDPGGGICSRTDGQQSKPSKQKTLIIIVSTVSGAGCVMGLLLLFICCPRSSVVRKRNAYLPGLTQLFKVVTGRETSVLG